MVIIEKKNWHLTVVINDNLSNSNENKQCNWLCQRDPVSPLLFNTTNVDMVKEIKDHPVTLYT
jgi:hypothetical protein